MRGAKDTKENLIKAMKQLNPGWKYKEKKEEEVKEPKKNINEAYEDEYSDEDQANDDREDIIKNDIEAILNAKIKQMGSIPFEFQGVESVYKADIDDFELEDGAHTPEMVIKYKTNLSGKDLTVIVSVGTDIETIVSNGGITPEIYLMYDATIVDIKPTEEANQLPY